MNKKSISRKLVCPKCRNENTEFVIEIKGTQIYNPSNETYYDTEVDCWVNDNMVCANPHCKWIGTMKELIEVKE